MALPVSKLHYLGQIYSPFSGLPADGEDGPNEGDPTLLFIYYGNASMFGYVSKRVQDAVSDVEDIDIDELPGILSVDGGVVFEVDTDWNGINYYGFAPTAD